MGCSQVATTHKKRAKLVSKRGRPPKGSLSSYPQSLVDLIYNLREKHEGWGAQSILIELEDEYGYIADELPDISSINRYLKQEGFMPEREPVGRKPPNERPKVKQVHDLWELDAQGAEYVKGLGYLVMINIKDVKSRVHCMAFPVPVKSNKGKAKTIHYFWALRLAFEQWGMPKAIQVDKDSVFIDNISKSPFPSRMYLFLISLGIDLHFIDAPPPKKQNIVERSHQTIERQVFRGQSYKDWQALFSYTNKRRKVLNQRMPNSSLGKKPPLVAFPQAKHSGRVYQVKQEQQLIDMKRVYKHLTGYCWYRKVSKVKTLSFNKQIYYLKNFIPETQVQITFCNRSKKIIFRDAKELMVAKIPIKNFSIKTIMLGTTKEIKMLKNKLYKNRDFPIEN